MECIVAWHCKLLFECNSCMSTTLHAIFDILYQCFNWHICATSAEDFEKEFTILGGDQLVRVRTSSARSLKAGAHTRDERLEGLFPEIIEFFHVQQDFLEVWITEWGFSKKKVYVKCKQNILVYLFFHLENMKPHFLHHIFI